MRCSIPTGKRGPVNKEVFKGSDFPQVQTHIDEQPSAVVRCISQLERRCCPGTPGSVPADNDSSAIRSDFILPSILSSRQTRTSSGISSSTDSFTVNPFTVTTLETGHGCCCCCGACNGMSSCFGKFTSAHRISVKSCDVGGRRKSKCTLIWECSGSSTEYACS